MALQIYRGPEASELGTAASTREAHSRRFSTETETPAVLSFAAFVTRRSNRRDAAPLSRAKALHANRTCRFCSHPVVEPVVLNDGLRDGSGEFVPGSATLVGFHCENCDAEWPALDE